jgi:hypothetical protein
MVHTSFDTIIIIIIMQKNAKFELPTAVVTKSTILSGKTPCSSMKVNQHFRGTCPLDHLSSLCVCVCWILRLDSCYVLWQILVSNLRIRIRIKTITVRAQFRTL